MAEATSTTTTPEWTSNHVRDVFVKYFTTTLAARAHPSRDDDTLAHSYVHSSSTLPHADPTLLFANAGMNQFKAVFLGKADPASDMGKLRRAVNSQKCIRAGGKHNDLDDVGRDGYHHTFFEMLGNWSFGDFFKREQVTFCWELMTAPPPLGYGLDKQRLYATYFEGHEALGLPVDTETRDLWLRYLPAERVIAANMKDNFWEMGATGPCGPCTEMHYDRLGGRDAAALVNQDDPMVIELWNAVFMQYNREDDGSLRPLPKQHCDTGMGLERIASVVQGKLSNYATDSFGELFTAMRKLRPELPEYDDVYGDDDAKQANVNTAYRVVADHVRTLTVAIADGSVPGAVGRNYVIRRIARRCVRYAREILKLAPGFFPPLVEVVCSQLGDFFPELRTPANKQRVLDALGNEETMFSRTFDNGMARFKQLQRRMVKDGKTQVSGADAFTLYSTYGFPVDLTERMAEEVKWTVDLAGFEEVKRQAAVQPTKDKGAQKLKMNVHQIEKLKGDAVPATDDSFKHGLRDCVATVQAIWQGTEFVNEVVDDAKQTFGIVLDRTSFYAEMGGQAYDTGLLQLLADDGTPLADSAGELQFRVNNTQAYGIYVLHAGHLQSDGGDAAATTTATTLKLRVGSKVKPLVDESRRDTIMNGHTATHMLNHALRASCGDGADQRGSDVQPDKLRFDFAQGKPLSREQVDATERHVVEQIDADLTVYTKEVALADGKAIKGLRSVFGEAYPDPVRVVSVGVPVDDLLAKPDNDEWAKYPIEFCGGTHLEKTSKAADFVILDETGCAAGVRRMTAITGDEAAEARVAGKRMQRQVDDVGAMKESAEFTAVVATLGPLIEKAVMPYAQKMALREQLKTLQKRVGDHKKAEEARQKQAAKEAVAKIVAEHKASPAERRCHVSTLEGPIKVLADAAKEAIAATDNSLSVMFLGTGQPSVAVQAVVCKAHLDNGLKANEWASAAAQTMGGKAGGKPDTAAGAGKDASKLDDALKAGKEFAEKKLA